MANLVAYTLELLVGGNLASDSDVLQRIGSANGSVAAGQVQGNIDANIASSVENGFYLRMTSNTTDGNQVINYSKRFTLINMNGTTSQVFTDGANAAQGTADVPSAQYNVIERVPSRPSASSTASATATAIPSSRPDSDGHSSEGSSTTTLVGLVVGGIFAVIGLASICIWTRLLWRKRRQRQRKEVEISARRRTAALMEFKAELPADGHALSPHPSELSPDSERFEAGSRREAAIEMQATSAIFELEGNHSDIHEVGTGRRSKAYEASLHEAGSGRRSRARDSML